MSTTIINQQLAKDIESLLEDGVPLIRQTTDYDNKQMPYTLIVGGNSYSYSVFMELRNDRKSVELLRERKLHN